MRFTLFGDGDLSPAEWGLAQIFDTEVGESLCRLLFLLSRRYSRIIFVIRRGFGVRRGGWLWSRRITSGAHRWLQALRESADRKTHSSLLAVLIAGELYQRLAHLMDTEQTVNKWHLHYYHIHCILTDLMISIFDTSWALKIYSLCRL